GADRVVRVGGRAGGGDDAAAAPRGDPERGRAADAGGLRAQSRRGSAAGPPAGREITKPGPERGGRRGVRGSSGALQMICVVAELVRAQRLSSHELSYPVQRLNSHEFSYPAFELQRTTSPDYSYPGPILPKLPDSALFGKLGKQPEGV